MKSSQLNYLNMGKTCLSTMDVNNAVWNGNPIITAMVASIKANILNIENLEGIQSDSAHGATISEHDAWAVAAKNAENVCNGIKAYFINEDDLINFEKVNYTISDFEYGQRNTVLDRMKKVYNAAFVIPIADLVNFNLVGGDITNLDNTIKAFDESIPGYNVIRTGTSAATKELPDAFTLMRKNFKKLDIFVATYKATKPSFYDAYKKSREIFDLGKTTVAEELDLMPKEFKAILGNKLKIGYWLTVRNHSKFPAIVYLTDDTNNLLISNEVLIPAENEYKLEVPSSFKGIFKHWLMVYNPNALDDVQVTVIMSKTKSQSGAQEKPNIA